jgi:membrane protease YdiL (CAAX protease family)
MNDTTRSTRTFWLLLALLALAAAVNPFLPQMAVPTSSPPAPALPLWMVSLIGVGTVLLLYGGLGYVGLVLWRRLKLPDLWTETVTNRQRFLIPALVGVAIGVVLIVADLGFSQFNGVGRLIHPPFPASLVATIAAAIGEEILFRLFFISFWSWLIGAVLLRSRGQPVVYWSVAVLSALLFAVAHLPALMYMLGVSELSQLSPVLLVQIILLNGVVSLFAAHYYRKSGFLAPVGIHFWADIVWHVLWGAL